MIRLILEAVKEWVEEVILAHRRVIIPDDYGAKGDGVTNDDNALLEGDFVYNLLRDKVYKVSKTKLYKIDKNKEAKFIINGRKEEILEK